MERGSRPFRPNHRISMPHRSSRDRETRNHRGGRSSSPARSRESNPRDDERRRPSRGSATSSSQDDERGRRTPRRGGDIVSRADELGRRTPRRGNDIIPRGDETERRTSRRGSDIPRGDEFGRHPRGRSPGIRNFRGGRGRPYRDSGINYRGTMRYPPTRGRGGMHQRGSLGHVPYRGSRGHAPSRGGSRSHAPRRGGSSHSPSRGRSSHSPGRSNSSHSPGRGNSSHLRGRGSKIMISQDDHGHLLIYADGVINHLGSSSHAPVRGRSEVPKLELIFNHPHDHASWKYSNTRRSRSPARHHRNVSQQEEDRRSRIPPLLSLKPQTFMCNQALVYPQKRLRSPSHEEHSPSKTSYVDVHQREQNFNKGERDVSRSKSETSPILRGLLTQGVGEQSAVLPGYQIPTTAGNHAESYTRPISKPDLESYSGNNTPAHSQSGSQTAVPPPYQIPNTTERHAESYTRPISKNNLESYSGNNTPAHNQGGSQTEVPPPYQSPNTAGNHTESFTRPISKPYLESYSGHTPAYSQSGSQTAVAPGYQTPIPAEKNSESYTRPISKPDFGSYFGNNTPAYNQSGSQAAVAPGNQTPIPAEKNAESYIRPISKPDFGSYSGNNTPAYNQIGSQIAVAPGYQTPIPAGKNAESYIRPISKPDLGSYSGNNTPAYNQSDYQTAVAPGYQIPITTGKHAEFYTRPVSKPDLESYGNTPAYNQSGSETGGTPFTMPLTPITPYDTQQASKTSVRHRTPSTPGDMEWTPGTPVTPHFVPRTPAESHPSPFTNQIGDIRVTGTPNGSFHTLGVSAIPSTSKGVQSTTTPGGGQRTRPSSSQGASMRQTTPGNSGSFIDTTLNADMHHNVRNIVSRIADGNETTKPDFTDTATVNFTSAESLTKFNLTKLTLRDPRLRKIRNQPTSSHSFKKPFCKELNSSYPIPPLPSHEEIRNMVEYQVPYDSKMARKRYESRFSGKVPQPKNFKRIPLTMSSNEIKSRYSNLVGLLGIAAVKDMLTIDEEELKRGLHFSEVSERNNKIALRQILHQQCIERYGEDRMTKLMVHVDTHVCDRKNLDMIDEYKTILRMYPR